MNEQNPETTQKPLPGLEGSNVYKAHDIPHPDKNPIETDPTEWDTEQVIPVIDEPDTVSHKSIVPDLTIIHEDAEERAGLYRRN